MDGMNRALLYGKKIEKEQEIIDAIFRETAEVFSVSQEDIKSQQRKRWVNAYPRYCANKFISKHTCRTLQEIGKILDKDHSTIIHYNKVTENLLDERFGDKTFKGKIEEIEKRMWNKYGLK